MKLHVDYGADVKVVANFAITPACVHEANCRIVTPLKSHTKPRPIETRPVAAEGAVKSDRIVAVDGRRKSARGHHPLAGIRLREVTVVIETGRVLRLLTNDLDSPAGRIAELHKTRWQVELFFRWVKQNLKIKRFLGTSENAIRIQIAVALITHLILRLLHRTHPTGASLTTFTRLVRANLMHRRPIQNLSAPPPPHHNIPGQIELALC